MPNSEQFGIYFMVQFTNFSRTELKKSINTMSKIPRKLNFGCPCPPNWFTQTHSHIFLYQIRSQIILYFSWKFQFWPISYGENSPQMGKMLIWNVCRTVPCSAFIFGNFMDHFIHGTVWANCSAERSFFHICMYLM